MAGGINYLGLDVREPDHLDSLRTTHSVHHKID